MEDEINFKLENIRRKVEKLEDEFDKKEEWKHLLNELNFVKIKVYENGIFSENEEFNEIKNEDIKYLLISYYQGEVLQKFMENREGVLKMTLQFFSEFYNILVKYDYLTKERKEYYKKITQTKDEDEEEITKPTLEELSRVRDEKILAFKFKKSLSEKLKVKIN